MKKYQIENSIGNGNFSTVYRAKQVASQKPCAIKVMKTHKKIALREATLLKKFKHPNVIALLDFEQSEAESWIVLEQAGINTLELYENHKHGLREEQVKCILFQAALGLAYVHSFGVIHRDVKPENLLIDKKTASVKLIDFGLAINESGVSTDYIATRWYRAPENLLGTKEYTCAIDVFSLGCVVVQLYLGSPLFPGANNLDQILKIFNILGYPTHDTWAAGYQKMLELGLKTANHNRETQMDLCEILHPCDSKLINLLTSMLALNPKKRISCPQIIKHQYFKDIRSIIPPSVYNRYEQDYLTKKQLNFKGIGQQKQPRLNLNSKYFIPPTNNPGSYIGSHKSKLGMHRSTQHQFVVNNQNNTGFRTKKSTSTDSMKSYYSHQDALNLVANDHKKLQGDGKSMLEESRSLQGFKPKPVQEKEQVPQVQDVQNQQKQILRKSTQLDPSMQEIKKSQTSTGGSTKNQSNIPIIPNVPTVKTHPCVDTRRYSTINEEQLNFSHRSPPSIIRSHQQQPPSLRHQPFGFFQNMQKFSIPPQGQGQVYQKSIQNHSKDKSFQGQRSFMRFQSKINVPTTRRNRFGQVNVSGNQDNSFRMPFSPQHHFQGLNLYRNVHDPNPRRPEQAPPRAYCSPTIHHFQSPPPSMLANRKNTMISPPHQNYRMQANSPENGQFIRGYIHSPRHSTTQNPHTVPAGFLPPHQRIKM